MTIDISNNAARVNYTVAQGVTQTSFSVPFEFFNDADLSVYVDDVLKTITTHYTVSGGDGSTGTVTISVTGASGGSTVVISRSIAIERTSDFVTGVDINRAALNTQLDTLTAIAADNKDKAGRSISAPNSEVNPQLELPDADTRKGKLVGFNETTGNVELSATLADGNTLASISGDIATLADIEDGTDATDAIQTVAGVSSNVTTVAGSIASVNTNAANITDIQNASANAATATTKAAEAVASATSANASELSAAGYATSANNSKNTAGQSATDATTAKNEAVGARNTATSAATSASNAASAASTSETNAAASAASASTSESNASTSETNAASSAASASTDAGTATTKAGEAATSATASATSASASEAAKVAAEAALDEFTDIYLGAKASDPTTDNDGNALTAGDQYFNTVSNILKIYNGSSWQAAAIDSSGFVEVTGDTMTGDLGFGDNDKAIFGAELEIYSDETHARIREYGSGQLKIQGDNMQLLTSDGASTYLEGNASTSAVTLYHASNAPKLATTSTGIDVTGTVTADDILLNTGGKFRSSIDTSSVALSGGTNSNVGANIVAYGSTHSSAANDLIIRRSGTKFALFDGATGDINFYATDGTTQAFHWDAADESLGIGNTSFTNKLNVTGAMPSSGTPLVQLSENSGGARDGLYLDYTGTTNSAVYSLKIADATKTHLAVRGDGNVGIGTASPTALIDISKSGTADYSTLRLSNTGASGRKYEIGLGGNAAASDYANKLYFRDSTANANRITLDSSGNVGIGTSSPHDFGVNCRVLTLNGVKGGSLALTRGTNSATKQWAIRTSDDDALRFEYGPTLASEAMRIDSSGRLLLNTTTEGNSAADDFTVSGSGNIGITIRSTTSNDSAIYFSDGISGASEYQGYIAYAHADNTFRFGVTGVECMRLDASGNLLVRKDGTTVGSIKSRNSESLMIGSDFGTDAYICLSNDNVFPVTSTGAVKDGATDLGVSTGRWQNLYLSRTLYVNATSVQRMIETTSFNTTSQYHHAFQNNSGTLVGNILVSTSATSFNTSSDYRLKTDVQPMTGASARVQELNPVNFEWLVDGTRVDGFLAHEAATVVPEAVTGTKDAMSDEEYEVTPAVLDDDGNVVTEAVMGTRSVPDYQSIDQSKLVPLLTAALQEALTEITALKARVTALEG